MIPSPSEPHVPDVVDVIGRYGPLVDRGKRGFQGFCPFCSGLEGTLFVRRDLQVWHCFGCGAGGDVYDYVARIEGLSREEAVDVVSQRFHEEEESVEISEPVAPGVSVSADAVPREAGAVGRSERADSSLPQVSAGESISHARTEEELFQQLLSQMEKASGYRGLALFDGSARLVACDARYPIAADLPELGMLLASIIDDSCAIAACERGHGNLVLSSKEGAVLLARAGSEAKVWLVLVRIADPATVAAARLRLMATCALLASQ